MNRKLTVALAAMLSLPLIAAAQDSAEISKFETQVPARITAPTTPDSPLPGPRVVTAEKCAHAPEICKARKEEMRRKRQACADTPADCRDPVLHGNLQANRNP